MTETTGSGEATISNQLATLVPSFDPAKDDMTIYQQKVELVLAAWPKGKITELITRLILNSHGTAFQKLQLHQDELMVNDPKSVQQLVTLLGGQWGRISLERRYQDAENALYNTVQKPDESNDSFLARADVLWMKLHAQKIKLEDLEAFIVLRGSRLTAEDKKKVILESDNSLEGKLTKNKVTEAVRLLGATFFGEMTGMKRETKTKVYDQTTLVATDEPEDEALQETLAVGEVDEEDYIDGLAMEGDDDATLVADFEMAATETLQEDPALAEAYNAYQDARRRLGEKFRNRGFWPVRSSPYPVNKGKGFSKGKHKQSFGGKSRRSLQDRILSSNCRICGKRGHWKAECPSRGTSSTTPSTVPGSASAVPTTTTIVDHMSEMDEIMPMEFVHLPRHSTIDEDTSGEVVEFFCQ